jgi:rhodanese-related sulfurtransferase
MARDQKVHTVRYSDLSLRQLERLNLPVILHLKGSRYSSAPDHYVVCTSVQNGQANLFNPPERVSQVPLDLLATRWDGHALILSADPINVPAVPLTERPVVQYSAVILLAALLIFGGYKYVRQHPAAPAGAWSQTAIAGVAQCLLITACAAALGFAARFALGMSILPTAATSLMPDGPDPMDFLVNVDSSGVIAERARDIDLATMHQAVQRGALLVDARDAGEYAAGHIKGAISCPANDVAHLRLYLAGIPLNRQIVVYCGSAQCGKGHYVASALLQNGFTNVAVWPPGWAQWSGPKETGAR